MKEMELNVMKRVEANDPVAMCHKGKMCNIDGDYDGALNICRRQLDWAMWKRIIVYQLCMMRGKVFRKTRKRESTIWNRLPLVVIPKLDTILVVQRLIVTVTRGQ